MNKFCTNCGKEIKEGAAICINCGKFLSRVPNNNTKSNSQDGLSIAGMVLGIISFLIIIILSLPLNELTKYLVNEEIYVKIAAGMIYTMFAFVPSIPGLILSVIGIKKNKTIIGIIGLMSNILTLVFCLGAISYLAS